MLEQPLTAPLTAAERDEFRRLFDRRLEKVQDVGIVAPERVNVQSEAYGTTI